MSQLQLGPPQVGPAAATGKENLTHGLACRYKLNFSSVFVPWQDLWTDANPAGQFKITHMSRCEEVNTIYSFYNCQKYNTGDFRELQELGFV